MCQNPNAALLQHWQRQKNVIKPRAAGTQKKGKVPFSLLKGSHLSPCLCDSERTFIHITAGKIRIEGERKTFQEDNGTRQGGEIINAALVFAFVTQTLSSSQERKSFSCMSRAAALLSGSVCLHESPHPICAEFTFRFSQPPCASYCGCLHYSIYLLACSLRNVNWLWIN